MDGKRLLSVAMAAVLLCTGLPQSTVYAEQGAAEQSITNEGNGSEQKSGQTEDGYQYKELEDGTLEITKYVGTATELEIPSEIEGKQVTSIGDGYVFYGCNNLNSVSIPEGVVSIGDYSFYGCYNLTSVMLPEGVASIGNGSFVGCSKLTSVKIPESVMSIGGDAFGGTALTSVVIPERVTSIREGVFGNCSSLTSVEIPEGVTSIGNNAFISCSNLTSVVIPEKVTSIGDLAFYCCNNLSNVNIPEGVTSIGDSAFGGTALTSVEIPEGVIRIRDRAFGGCSSLTSVSIPEGVTYIGDGAFCGTALTSVELPKGVTGIGELAFSECYNLTSVKIPEGVISIGDKAFYNCYNLTSVELPKGVTYIGDSAFYSCTGLKNVSIPEGMKNIGDNAFRNCIGLTSVIIPEGVTSIGNFAFWNCSRLTDVTIQKGVESIGDYVFQNCNKLTSVSISEGVKSIGSSTFCGCPLTNVVIPKTVESIGKGTFVGCKNVVLYVHHDSYAEQYAKDNSINYCYIEECKHSYKCEITTEPTCTGAGETTYTCTECGDSYKESIPAKEHNLEEVVKQATEKENGSITKLCTDCNAVEGEPTVIYAAEKIELSENSYVYDGSAKRPTVTIKDSQGNDLQERRDYTISCPENAKEEGSYTITITFSGNYTGTAERIFTILPGENGSWGDYTYRKLEDGSLEITKYNGNDTELKIPKEIEGKRVTSIGNEAFAGCSNLTSVSIPKGVTSIGEKAFDSCVGLTSVSIPKGVTSIGKGAFWDCNSLTSVSIPEGVKSIEDFAFRRCSSLMSVEIPEGVTSIGATAFQNCSSLTSVKIPEEVTSIGNAAFDNCSNLINVEIPEGVMSIGATVFQNCSSLTSVKIPRGIKIIGDFIFNGCSSLNSVKIPEGVISIGSQAFCGCESLTSVEFPKGVKGIGRNAFWGCRNLTSVELPEGVTSIGEGAFWGCHNLTSMELPEGVTSIGPHAFYGCESLTSVELPEGVTSIENDVFSGCSSLRNVSIPKGVTEIRKWAFRDCDSLIKVSIPKGVTNISDDAFLNCPNLVLYVYHDSYAEQYAKEHSIDYRYIEECEHNYKEVITKATEKENGSIIKQCTECQAVEGEPTIIYAAEKIELSETSYVCDGSVKKPSVTVKDSQDNILQEQRDYTVAYPENAKEEGTYSITITFSGNYTGTAERAFTIIADDKNGSQGDYTYHKLEDGSLEITKYNGTDTGLVIPDKLDGITVTKIGKHAFSNCTNLESIIIPESVVSIGAGAFSGCSNLTSVAIPESVTSIEEDAFMDCSKELALQVAPGSYGESYAEENNVNHNTAAVCEHTYAVQTTKEPTCTVAGEKVYTCTKCGDIEKRETIPALGHTYQKEVSKATTKKNGSITEKCTKCGNEKIQTTISAVKTVKLSKTSYVYNGKTQKPSITVKDSKGKVLNSQKDYTVTYPKTVKNVGIYTVKIKLKGNYSGTVTKTYTITPKGTSISKITPKKKSFVVTWKKQAKQITGYEVAYAPNAKFAKKNTTILNVAKSKTTAKPKKALKAKKKYYVRIRTYKTIKQGGKTQKIYSGWSKTKSVTTKK